MKAVLGKLRRAGGEDIGALLKTVGMTLVSTVGGAAGPLYGTLFLQMGVGDRRQERARRRTTGPLRSTRRSRASQCEGRRSRATRRWSTP